MTVWKRKVAVRKLSAHVFAALVSLRVRVERAVVKADPSAKADGRSAAVGCATKLHLHLY